MKAADSNPPSAREFILSRHPDNLAAQNRIRQVSAKCKPKVFVTTPVSLGKKNFVELNKRGIAGRQAAFQKYSMERYLNIVPTNSPYEKLRTRTRSKVKFLKIKLY